MTPYQFPGARPWFHEGDVAVVTEEVGEILRSGRLVLGRWTELLEQEFRELTGCAHAVAVSSCTAALEISLRHAFHTRGRASVLVPINTFVATYTAALNAIQSVRPLGPKDRDRLFFVGMDLRNYCLDVDEAISILSGTEPPFAALVVVHIAGLVHPRINEVLAAAERRGTLVVEDCAHATGAKWNSLAAGSLGYAGCFSLYPTKIATGGTGGVITTDDPKLAAYARAVRHHGGTDQTEHIRALGNDWLLPEINALIASTQMARLPQILLQRNRVVNGYFHGLINSTGGMSADTRVSSPYDQWAPSSHAFYKFPLQIPVGVKPQLREYLAQSGIQTGALYDPPLSGIEALPYQALPRERFKAVEETLARQICLPLYPGLTEDDVAMIVRTFRRGLDVCEGKA